MQVVSVNIGQERNLQSGKSLGSTGIFKLATSEAVLVTELGLRDDFVCDVRNHGGPDQAVYVYGQADYDWWAGELGQPLAPGTFGENLTISGLESADFTIGDRLHMQQVILEVSAPRIPCATLAARMGDPRFVKRYRQAERPGLYCRVIQTGSVRVGEDVRIEKFAGESITVLDMFRSFYDKHKSEAELRRQLRAPVAIRARVDLEQELRVILGQK
ncbi:MAG TPA: MOSC domain-containing protein [Anaerolineales bacterium]|jgi:MOSC domain-containing protein YiiM